MSPIGGTAGFAQIAHGSEKRVTSTRLRGGDHGRTFDIEPPNAAVNFCQCDPTNNAADRQGTIAVSLLRSLS